MTTGVTQGSPVPGGSSWRPRPGWPLQLVFLSFPIWWILGLGALIFMIAAVPMAAQLWRRRAYLQAPRGFGVWLFFLAWVLLGAGVLWADAPGAVPGGGASRLLVFGWRFAWYLACTIVLLYIGNLSERELPSGKIFRLLALMFVFTTAGGLLGTLLPEIQLVSPVELVLPQGLTKNAFVRDIVHPKTAEIETILGYDQARPMAPFAYSNTWGAAYAFFLPYFLIVWVFRASRNKRIAGFVILALSAVPAVYSLNRGLWLALGLIGLFMLVKLLSLGGARMMVRLVAGVIVVGVMIMMSPLPELVQTRLSNPHSNNRRALLTEQTVRSALTGSPLVGFGSTRDVQGNLESVAGGARPNCSACASPPLGTQGHLWLLIFTNGLVGTAAFLAFFGLRFAVHLREKTAISLAGCSVLLAFGLFLFTYDLVEVPLYTVMISVALMWRASRDTKIAALEARA